MSLSASALGQMPKSVRDGCRVVFAQTILDKIATPDGWAAPLKPDPEDGEVMTAYYTLAKEILSKYNPTDTFGFGPRPKHLVTLAIQDDILVKDYRTMADHFHGTFAIMPDQKPPRAFLEYMASGIRQEAPVDNGGCADDCCQMEVVVDPIALMHYRWEVSQLADYLIFKFELPPPGGKPCLVWSSQEWKHWYQMNDAEYQENHIMFMALNHSNVIRNIETQGRRFSQQFYCYIASAITQAGFQQGDGQRQTQGVCFQIIDFLKALVETEKERAQTWKKEDPIIQRQFNTCWKLMGIAVPHNEA